jgi:hypothetical protein
MDVCGGEGVEELALEGPAAMGDGIDFEIPGPRDVAVEGADGDHGFQEPSGAGGGVEAPAQLELVGFKSTIELACTDGQKLLFQIRGEVKAFPCGGEPKGDGFFKALATEVAGGLPEFSGDLKNGRTVWARATAVDAGLDG